EEYLKHVRAMLVLLGDLAGGSSQEAATVLKIETALATASMKNTDLRDPDKTYHKMPLAELKTLTPNFSWESYFKAVGHPEFKEINVGQPDFFKALDAQLTATSIAEWKTYLRWHLVNSAAPGLSERFVQEDFDFRGKTLTGAKEIQPRWKRCVQSTDRHLGWISFAPVRVLPRKSKSSWTNTSRSISRRRPRRAPSRWFTICLQRFAMTSQPCPGWVRKRAPRPPQNSKLSP